MTAEFEKPEICIQMILDDISQIIEDSRSGSQLLYKESILPDLRYINENEKIKLLYAILRNLSDEALLEVRNSITNEEVTVLDHLLDALKTKTGDRFCDRFDADDVIDDVGDMLDLSGVDKTFYEILLIYIMEAGYRKASDFYTKLNIERRYWARYKKGFIPPKRKIMEMIIFLQLDYDDAEYLLNMAGLSFQKNVTTDLIIAYFLKNGYSEKMTPEALFMLIDEVLENFGQKPLHSEL